MEFSGRRDVVKPLGSGIMQQPEYNEDSGPGQGVEYLHNGSAQQPGKTDITSSIDTILRSGSGTMK